LRRAAVALGELERGKSANELEILLTETLQAFLDEFEWNQGSEQIALLTEIHRFCHLLFLSGGSSAVRLVDVDSTSVATAHPAPADCSEEGFVSLWCEEMGQVYARYRQALGPSEKDFVAIACARKFSGEEGTGYVGGNDEGFMLVGPNDLSNMGDAFVWDVASEIKDQVISFDEAKKHLSIIGCYRIDKPKGGSHYKAHFHGGRPWVLDPNADPIPPRYIAELEEISGYPTLVVRSALKMGKLPPRVLRVF
jgi:hypothetical protein